MPKYRFHYFDARGRGEQVRILFHLAGVEFEDVRLSVEEWHASKETYRFRQLPVLEVDGKQYGQCLAIMNYLAREFGLYGKTNLDALTVDMVNQIVVEMWELEASIFYEQDPTKKAELIKKFVEELVPAQLAKFDKLLKENGTGYFVGSSLTLCDIMVFSFFSEVQRKADRNALEKFPEVKRHASIVSSNEKISNYLANRKETVD